jgi:hypothetical protein
LGNAGPARHELGKIGAIARGNVPIAQPVGENARRLSLRVLVGRISIRTVGAEPAADKLAADGANSEAGGMA